jgi:phosphohistidine phosphatase SixA
MFQLVPLIGAAIGLAIGSTGTAELRREELMAALKQGGYTIMLRHARTDRSFNEAREYVPARRSEQRNLNDAGVADARLMGVVLKKYGIPIGEIISSPMFRTTETAEYAAGVPTTTMVLRTFPSTPEQAALVAKAPKAGTNRLVVTHHFVIETHVPGIKPGDINESEAAVIRHLSDGKVELVGRILLADWQALAGDAATVSSAAAAPASASATPAGAPAVAHAAPRAGAPVTHATTVVFPATMAGHLAQAYIETFNSGDAARMRTFIEQALAVNPARSTDVRVDGYKTLFAASGPLVVKAITSATEQEVVVAATNKGGDVTVTVKMATDVQHRIGSVTFAGLRPGGHP